MLKKNTSIPDEFLLTLTKDMLPRQIEDIRKNAIEYQDDEVAHKCEDDLRHWFIACLANDRYTREEAVEIAKIILSTSDIPFCRWYA